MRRRPRKHRKWPYAGVLSLYGAMRFELQALPGGWMRCSPDHPGVVNLDVHRGDGLATSVVWVRGLEAAAFSVSAGGAPETHHRMGEVRWATADEHIASLRQWHIRQHMRDRGGNVPLSVFLQ